MPDSIPSVFSIIALVLGGLGVLGKFTLDFIKSERSNSVELTKEFINQLKQQGAECTTERLRREEFFDKALQRWMETQNKFADDIRAHTEASKANYHVLEQLTDTQSEIIQKLGTLALAIAQEAESRNATTH